MIFWSAVFWPIVDSHVGCVEFFSCHLLLVLLLVLLEANDV